jgi:hypothetical protein
LNANGSATQAKTFSSSGQHSVVASYGGDINYTQAQSAPVVVTINNAPQVTSVVPDKGPQKMWITVNGTGFGASQGTSTITLGGTTMPVVNNQSSDTAIVVQVPAVTTTLPANLQVVVTVGGTASQQTAYSGFNVEQYLFTCQ